MGPNDPQSAICWDIRGVAGARDCSGAEGIIQDEIARLERRRQRNGWVRDGDGWIGKEDGEGSNGKE